MFMAFALTHAQSIRQASLLGTVLSLRRKGFLPEHHVQATQAIYNSCRTRLERLAFAMQNRRPQTLKHEIHESSYASRQMPVLRIGDRKLP